MNNILSDLRSDVTRRVHLSSFRKPVEAVWLPKPYGGQAPEEFVLIYDVLIAGAGPVGLFLACELRLADLSVLVLEQAEDPRSPLKRLPFGMRGLSAPTIEAFYRRGLLDDIATPPRVKDDSGSGSAWLPHIGCSSRAARAAISPASSSITTTSTPRRGGIACQVRAGTSMAAELEYLESVLAARATAMGVEIRRGLGVEDFDQSEEDVTVRASGEIFRGRWLVGCDGGRSTVRKAGGFEFVGTDPEFTGYSVQVEMADPDKLTPGRHYTPTGMYTYQKPGTLAMVDFDGGAFHRTSRSRSIMCSGCCAISRTPMSP
ncbi:MAG: NAD(P)/FAD-dependent oxidoreductase [Gammaproteobacteria bacterium]